MKAKLTTGITLGLLLPVEAHPDRMRSTPSRCRRFCDRTAAAVSLFVFFVGLFPARCIHAFPVGAAQKYDEKAAAAVAPRCRDNGIPVVPLGWLQPRPGQDTGPPDIVSEEQLRALGECYHIMISLRGWCR